MQGAQVACQETGDKLQYEPDERWHLPRITIYGRPGESLNNGQRREMERFPTYLYQKYPDAPKPFISGIGDDNTVPESQSILHLRIGIKYISRRSYF